MSTTVPKPEISPPKNPDYFPTEAQIYNLLTKGCDKYKLDLTKVLEIFTCDKVYDLATSYTKPEGLSELVCTLAHVMTATKDADWNLARAIISLANAYLTQAERYAALCELVELANTNPVAKVVQDKVDALRVELGARPKPVTSAPSKGDLELYALEKELMSH